MAKQLDLEGYKFNDSGVISGRIKSIIYLKIERYLNSFYSQNGAYGNTTFKPNYDMSFTMRKDFDKKIRLKFSAQMY
jgi:hypothetical protein